jgi:hypothetical protein
MDLLVSRQVQKGAPYRRGQWLTEERTNSSSEVPRTTDNCSSRFPQFLTNSLTIKAGISKLRDGSSLETISNFFFSLFPAIYALTSTPGSLIRRTEHFLG